MRRESQYRILVADDNQTNQCVIREMLEFKGYSVDTVSSGEAAIDALQQQSFDLLILDCVMPGMDGFDTARSIRQSKASNFDPAIPILAITALAAPEDRDRCLVAGMNNYICKPVMADTLFNCVASLLRGEPAVGDMPAASEARDSEAKPRFMNLEQIVRSMSGHLNRDIRKWRRELFVAISTGNMQRVREVSHTIRGTADIVGSRRLSKVSEAMENSAANADENGVRALQPELMIELLKLARETRPNKPGRDK